MRIPGASTAASLLELQKVAKMFHQPAPGPDPVIQGIAFDPLANNLIKIHCGWFVSKQFTHPGGWCLEAGGTNDLCMNMLKSIAGQCIKQANGGGDLMDKYGELTYDDDGKLDTKQYEDIKLEVQEQVLSLDCAATRKTQAIFCDGSYSTYGFPLENCNRIADQLKNSKCDKALIDEESLLVTEHLRILASNIAYDNRELLVLNRHLQDIIQQMEAVKLRLKHDQDVLFSAENMQRSIATGTEAAAAKAVLSVSRSVKAATLITQTAVIKAHNENANVNMVRTDTAEVQNAVAAALTREVVPQNDFSAKKVVEETVAYQDRESTIAEVKELFLQKKFYADSSVFTSERKDRDAFGSAVVNLDAGVTEIDATVVFDVLMAKHVTMTATDGPQKASLQEMAEYLQLQKFPVEPEFEPAPDSAGVQAAKRVKAALDKDALAELAKDVNALEKTEFVSRLLQGPEVVVGGGDAGMLFDQLTATYGTQTHSLHQMAEYLETGI